MTDPIVIPPDLERAAKERRLLPFIGSGFSRNISPDFPTWEGVIDIAADLLGFDKALLRMHGDHLQIAEYLRLRGETGELVLRLIKLLDDDNAHSVSSSPPHLLLPHLDCTSVYTTNWDRWIERAFDHQGTPYVPIRKAQDLATLPLKSPAGAGAPIHSHSARRNGPTHLIKFHGDFSDPSSLVIAEQDYFRRLEFEDPLDISLRASILGKSVVFIGYSFTDPNMRLMWFKLRNAVRGHSVQLKSFFVTAQHNPVLEEVMTGENIVTVHLDSLNIKASAEQFLQQLIALQESAPV